MQDLIPAKVRCLAPFVMDGSSLAFRLIFGCARRRLLTLLWLDLVSLAGRQSAAMDSGFDLPWFKSLCGKCPLACIEKRENESPARIICFGSKTKSGNQKDKFVDCCHVGHGQFTDHRHVAFAPSGETVSRFPEPEWVSVIWWHLRCHMLALRFSIGS